MGRDGTTGREDPRGDNGVVEGALAAVREHLGMEVAYVSRFAGGEQRVEAVEGDGERFGIRPGLTIPFEETFCARMVGGELPNVIPDTAADERVAQLPVTEEAGIGAYVGVPVRLSSGRVYGSFCCVSREPDHDLRERDARFVSVVARLVAEHLEREELERETRMLEVQAAGFGALLAALEARDSYTGEHSEAVVRLAGMVALRLGLAPNAAREVEQVALIHDIGKLGIPDAILHKEGPLTESEWEVMKTHPRVGADIVAAVPSVAHLAPAVRAEHERWDGGGYPDGLAGEAIPLASRIVLACDAWHAMRSDRPYRRRMAEAEALLELEACAATQFCPQTVAALLAVIAAGGAEVAVPLRPLVETVPASAAGDLTVVADGDVDMLRAPELAAALDDAIRRASATLNLDLSRVSYLDSHGLAALVQALRRSRLAGRRLVLVQPSEAVLATLDAAGLLDQFEVAGVSQQLVA